MGCINLVAFFLTCLILQVHSRPLPCNYQYINRKLDNAKNVLEDLEKIIRAVVKIGLEAISGLESSLKAIQKYAVKFSKALVDKVGNDVFKWLDGLKKEANDIGIEIIECIEDREDDIKRMLVVFANTTTQCAVQRIDEVLDSFVAVFIDVQDADIEFKNLTQRLENCGSDTECILQVMADIEKAAIKVPAKVKEDIMKAEQKVHDLLDYLFECEHDTINQLEITSQEIFNGIVECAESQSLDNEIPQSR